MSAEKRINVGVENLQRGVNWQTEREIVEAIEFTGSVNSRRIRESWQGERTGEFCEGGVNEMKEIAVQWREYCTNKRERVEEERKCTQYLKKNHFCVGLCVGEGGGGG